MTTALISGSDQMSWRLETVREFRSWAYFSARAESWSQTDFTVTSLRVLSRSTKPGAWMWAAPTSATVILVSDWASAGKTLVATVAVAVVRRKERRVEFIWSG